MFQTTIKSGEHLFALIKECCRLFVDFRYNPADKCFRANTIVDSDRFVLLNLNNKYYV